MVNQQKVIEILRNIGETIEKEKLFLTELDNVIGDGKRHDTDAKCRCCLFGQFMVGAFWNMANAGNNIDITLLSSGIYEAIIILNGLRSIRKGR